ncbi:MAG: FecR family protein [Mucilaginibacter sp.]
MESQRINHLLQKYLDGSITNAEKEELLALYRHIGSKDAEYPDDKETVSERMLARLNDEIISNNSKPNYFKPWKLVAAALILITAALYLINRPVNRPPAVASNLTRHSLIVPGTSVATLILGNGKKILLNGSGTGTLAVQGNTVITRSAAGQISYKVMPDSKNNEITFNTITTPMGGQFRITLPDGSDVWLNAASSLRYPSRFEGSERHVELHGEAYFEIFKNKHAPFTVTAENTHIKVLGTHFNVMAYNNEPAVNTTLLEGSVSLSSNNSHVFLVPGQQATAGRKTANIILRQVNVDDAIAWKNGYFSFRKENLPTAMNKIARWYNVDVDYIGNVNDRILGGTVSRAESIEELLNYLELTGIAKFKIEGRRIKVICK